MTFILHDKTFFEHPFVKLFSEHIKNNTLEPRIIGLCSAPKIIDQGKALQIQLNTGRCFDVTPDFLDINYIIDGLCIMYGFGLLCANYTLKIFSGLDTSEIMKIRRKCPTPP